MIPHLFLLFVAHTLLLYSQTSFGQRTTDSLRNELGIEVHDVIISTLQLNDKGISVIEVKAYWKNLEPSITQDIQHNCGADAIFTALLPTSTKTIIRNKYSLRNVSCSFTNDYVLIKAECWTPLAISEVLNIAEMRVNSYKTDEEEVCTLRLHGYEKHPSIFITYSYGEDKNRLSKDKGLSVVKFPQGLSNLLISSRDKQGGGGYVLFDPEQGKGKSFLRMKKCVETILTSKSVERIEEKCVIECDDTEDMANFDTPSAKTEL
jgi:hypothetical protein